MFCEINGVVRIAAVIDISTRGFHQIVHCFFIHVCRADSCQFFSVRPCGICSDQTSSVKRIQAYNLNIFDLNNISRLYLYASFSRYSPFYPCFHRLFRSDKWNRYLFSFLIRSGHTTLKNMGCKFSAHMVLMIMGSQNCIYMSHRKRINNKWHSSQIRLHFSPSAHISHLMTDFHLTVSMGSFSVSTPKINGNITVSRCFEPNAGTA